jgi:hypothetical protein
MARALPMLVFATRRRYFEDWLRQCHISESRASQTRLAVWVGCGYNSGVRNLRGMKVRMLVISDPSGDPTPPWLMEEVHLANALW